jgi:hypothetical protein
MHDISNVEIGETKMRDDQRYNTLRNLDEQSDTSTEVGDWEAESDMKPRQSKRGTFWRGVKHYRWLLDTTLLLIIVGLLAEKRWRHGQSHQYEFAGDITGFAPRCKNRQEVIRVCS